MCGLKAAFTSYIFFVLVVWVSALVVVELAHLIMVFIPTYSSALGSKLQAMADQPVVRHVLGLLQSLRSCY